MAHKKGDVQWKDPRGGRLIARKAVPAVLRPIGTHDALCIAQVRLAAFPAKGEGGETAVAADTACDALIEETVCLLRPERRQIGMGMRVDEARRDRQPGGVDDLARGQLRPADRTDLPVRDVHATGKGCGAGAVDECPAPDLDVRQAHRIRA